MKKIYIFLFSCVTVLSAVAQTTPNLYRAVDKEKMNHWVDSVFDAMSYDERIGQLFMIIANPKSDTRNMQRLMRYVKPAKSLPCPDARVVGRRMGTFHAPLRYDPFPEEHDVGGD